MYLTRQKSPFSYCHHALFNGTKSESSQGIWKMENNSCLDGPCRLPRPLGGSVAVPKTLFLPRQQELEVGWQCGVGRGAKGAEPSAGAGRRLAPVIGKSWGGSTSPPSSAVLSAPVVAKVAFRFKPWKFRPQREEKVHYPSSAMVLGLKLRSLPGSLLGSAAVAGVTCSDWPGGATCPGPLGLWGLGGGGGVPRGQPRSFFQREVWADWLQAGTTAGVSAETVAALCSGEADLKTGEAAVT